MCACGEGVPPIVVSLLPCSSLVLFKFYLGMHIFMRADSSCLLCACAACTRTRTGPSAPLPSAPRPYQLAANAAAAAVYAAAVGSLRDKGVLVVAPAGVCVCVCVRKKQQNETRPSGAGVTYGYLPNTQRRVAASTPVVILTRDKPVTLSGDRRTI